MDRETEKLLEEVQEISEKLFCEISGSLTHQERVKIAIELQRNKILKKELEDIYWKLEEIKYSMENGVR